MKISDFAEYMEITDLDLKKIKKAKETGYVNIQEKFKMIINLQMQKKYYDNKVYTGFKEGPNIRNFLKNTIREKNKKEFFVFALLDNNSRLRYYELIPGKERIVEFSTREISLKALISNSSYVFIGHNHPSGIAIPSREDINFTKKLKKQLNSLEICLIDHIIITEDDNIYFSFKENDLI
jgi:DNA repair protein RadC